MDFILRSRRYFWIMWPIICLLIFLVGIDEKIRLLYIILLVYGFTLNDNIPLVITSLIPLFLVPMLYIQKSSVMASGYFSNTILAMSAMINSITLQYSGIHERLVFWVILKLGCTPRKITLGLLIISHVLSMFLSNTFTAYIMIPVAMKIYYKTYKKDVPTNSIDILWVRLGIDEVMAVKPTKLGIAYVFAIIFGSQAGGINFSRGSPTNSSFLLLYKHRFNCYFNQDIWFLFTLPVSIIISIVNYCWLLIMYLELFRCKYLYSSDDYKEYDDIVKDRKLIEELYNEIGPVSWHEILVGILFVFGICLWCTRKPFGKHGWQALLMKNCCIQDSASSLFISFLMMIVPSDNKFLYSFSKNSYKRPTKDTHGLVTWRVLQRQLIWNHIITMGCMYSISILQMKTGLARYLAEKISFLKYFPMNITIMISTFFILWLTELFQNFITSTALLPIFFELAVILDLHPMSISYIACLCSSLSFVTPIASKSLKIITKIFIVDHKDLLRVGLLPKVLSYVILIFMYLTYGKVFYYDELQPGWVYDENECYCTKCKWDKELKYLVLRLLYF